MEDEEELARIPFNQDHPEETIQNHARHLQSYAQTSQRFQQKLKEWNTQKSRISPPIKKVIKGVVGFFVGSLCSLIAPVSNTLGSVSYLAPVIVLLTDMPSATIGKMLESTLLMIIVNLISLAIVSVVIWLALATAIAHYYPIAALICGGSIFFWFMIFSYVKESLPTVLGVPILLGQIQLVLGICIEWRYWLQTGAIYPSFLTSLLYPVLLGSAIAMLINATVFPERTSPKISRHLMGSILNITGCVDISLKSILKESSPEEDAQITAMGGKARSEFTTLHRHFQQSKIELGYGIFSTEDLNFITSSIQRLLSNMRAMQLASTRTISEHAEKKMIDLLLPAVRDSLLDLMSIFLKFVLRLEEVSSNRSATIEAQWEDLNAAIAKFKEEQEGIVLQWITNEVSRKSPWEAIFHIYFYIFEMLQFGNELGNLGNLLRQKFQKKARFFFPYKPWLRKVIKGLRQTEMTPLSARLGVPVQVENQVENPQHKESVDHGADRQMLRYRIWASFRRFSNYKWRFAFKSSVQIMVVAFLAFVPYFEGLFAEWRGEWALVSILAITAPTVGGNLLNGGYRLVGTALGAGWAILSWVACGPNPYLLSLFIVAFTVPFYYVKENTAYPKVGLVSILTYLVILLRKLTIVYDPSAGVDEDIYTLAYKRGLAGVVAVLVVAIIGRFLWPYYARKELRLGLALTLYDIGVYYKQIFSSFINLGKLEKTFSEFQIPNHEQEHDQEQHEDQHKDPDHQHGDQFNCNGHDGLLIPMSAEVVEAWKNIEYRVSTRQLYHESLFQLVKGEPRMKGEFPYASYRKMLDIMQRIVDRLQTLRTVVSSGFPAQSTCNIVMRIQNERNEMVKSTLILIHMLVACIQSKNPIPRYLPDPLKDRDSALGKFRLLTAVQDSHRPLDHINYYTYVATTGDFLLELQSLVEVLKDLFGEDQQYFDLV